MAFDNPTLKSGAVANYYGSSAVANALVKGKERLALIGDSITAAYSNYIGRVWSPNYIGPGDGINNVAHSALGSNSVIITQAHALGGLTNVTAAGPYTWSAASKTLTLVGAFTSYSFVAGDKVYVGTGTGVTPGFYTFTRTSNDVITLSSSIASSDTADVYLSPACQLSKQPTNSFHFGTSAQLVNAQAISYGGAWYTNRLFDFFMSGDFTHELQNLNPLDKITNQAGVKCRITYLAHPLGCTDLQIWAVLADGNGAGAVTSSIVVSSFSTYAASPTFQSVEFTMPSTTYPPTVTYTSLRAVVTTGATVTTGDGSSFVPVEALFFRTDTTGLDILNWANGGYQAFQYATPGIMVTDAALPGLLTQTGVTTIFISLGANGTSNLTSADTEVVKIVSLIDRLRVASPTVKILLMSYYPITEKTGGGPQDVSPASAGTTWIGVPTFTPSKGATTWTKSTSRTLVMTGAFTGYSFTTDDHIWIPAGNGWTAGWYKIASVTNANTLVLDAVTDTFTPASGNNPNPVGPICNRPQHGVLWSAFQELDAQLQLVCQKRANVGMVSVFNMFQNQIINNAKFLSDGTHPTESGAYIFLEQMWNVLNSAGS